MTLKKKSKNLRDPLRDKTARKELQEKTFTYMSMMMKNLNHSKSSKEEADLD